MESKTINCVDCSGVFTYMPPIGHVDKRKYCDDCARKRKIDWDNKDKVVQQPTASGSVELNTPTDLKVVNELVYKDKPTGDKFAKDPVGLAVEIFIASMDKFEPGQLDNAGAEIVMAHCIELVRQARKEFE